MTDDEIGDEAVVIANGIEAVLTGRDSAAAVLAIGMVIGRHALDDERPDYLSGLMERLRSVAISVMQQHRHSDGSRH